eukprot:TRINITY_DN11104_c0_g3_i1.p1 TRINITY_DN11104_c0_g3~~TRINITY_DN11104_c0_g3_i1.p1  ORF type:complete len:154 (+),score=12.88 TRINITY_DN11104_c0_g3_i1:61-522(+)
MAGRSTMGEQSPSPEFVPAPRFQSSPGHSCRGGPNVTIVVYSSLVLTLQSSPGLTLRGGAEDTINVSSSSTARDSALSVPKIMLPRRFLAALHSQGRCLPCRYHKQAGGCKLSARCNYCHSPHDDWSLSKTQKNFRKHIGEYSDQHGLRAGES